MRGVKDVRKLFPKSSTCKKSVSEEGSVIEETVFPVKVKNILHIKGEEILFQ